jgi:hypothetical protein
MDPRVRSYSVRSSCRAFRRLLSGDRGTTLLLHHGRINPFSPEYIKVPVLCDMLIVMMMSELASPGQYHPLQVLPVEKLVSSFFIYSIII